MMPFPTSEGGRSKTEFHRGKSPSPALATPALLVERQSSSSTTTTEGDVQLMSEGPLHRSSKRTMGKHRPGFNMHKQLIDDNSVLVSSSSPPAPAFAPSTCLIDNSVLVYIPVRLRCGVTAMCRPDVLARCPSVLRHLNRDVQGCLDILPRSVHALIRRTRVWVNTTFYYGARDRPRNVNHSTAHHHEAWLVWARDKPEKAQSIEIYNCFDYEAMRLHWNGCGLLLHEFCHLIHQLTLPDGLENGVVKEAYKIAKNSGLYESVLRRDWAGMECESDMAYAMVNHKEFFSEISVSYLCDAYCDLDASEHGSMEQCSPPLMAPAAVERVQDRRRTVMPIDGSALSAACYRVLGPTELSATTRRDDNASLSFLFGYIGKDDSSRRSSSVRHCNKFYPFTCGQLRRHDAALYAVFSDLWKKISEWVDEDDDSLMRCCWPR